MLSESENGIVSLPSRHSVDETVAVLSRLIEQKGITLFTVIDHSGEAEKIGLIMPNTKLLIFGSPKAGTPLMLAAPEIAIDLPLKILVREDHDGRTWISYNSSEFIAKRHSLPAELTAPLAAPESLARQAT